MPAIFINRSVGRIGVHTAAGEFLSNIARLYRGEIAENRHDSADMMASKFPDGVYVDVPGLCKVATVAEIEDQGGVSTRAGMSGSQSGKKMRLTSRSSWENLTKSWKS